MINESFISTVMFLLAFVCFLFCLEFKFIYEYIQYDPDFEIIDLLRIFLVFFYAQLRMVYLE